MTRDPHFRYVKSLLNFDSELAGVDPNAGALIGYADLTEKVQVELSAGGVTPVGAPFIGEVAGKSAMVLNGASALYMSLGAGMNATHTIEFEAYIASVSTAQGVFCISSTVSGGDINMTIASTGVFSWMEQNGTSGTVSAGTIGVGWHTFAISYTASGAAGLYVDGVRVGYFGTVAVGGTAWSLLQLGRNGTSTYAAAGTAFRKLRVYRGVAKYTTPTYTVEDPGLPSRLLDPDGAQWFESAPVALAAPSKFGPLAAHFAGGSGLLRRGFDFSGDFTIEFWLLVEGSTADWPRLVGQTGAATGSFWLNITPEKSLCLVMRGSGTTVGTRAVGTKVADDGWNHCAVVRKGNAVAFFLGGELQYAVQISGVLPPDNAFAVGCIANSYSTTSRLYGAVDGLRVTVGKARYDFTVEPNFYSTVFYEHPNGASYPFTDNNRNKTVAVYGITTVQRNNPFGEWGYVAKFNGTSSYAYTGTHADFSFGTGDFTVEWWGNSANVAGDRAVMASDHTTFSGAAVAIFQNGSQVRLASAADGDSVVAAGGDYSDGWHHFVVERASGVAHLYVDGVLSASGPCPSGIDLSGDSRINFGRARYALYYSGYITDLRVTKGVARYTADFTPTKIVEATGSFTPPTEAFAAAATTVSGVVTDSSNSPCGRRVYAYSHADGRFLGDAVSDPVTGVFEIAVPERAFVVALDTDASGQNAIVLDRIDPV